MTPDANTLRFTGERFLPEVRGAIWYEHWHRYAAVVPLAAGKRVVDAACGEGYGSFLLGATAAAVTGVDVSAEAIAHASARYSRANLDFVVGSVTALPLPAASVDLVVSFETIEHLAEQREMLADFRRVLTADGVLVISSPNRPVYNEAGAIENHYHVRELDRAELAALLASGFPQQAWYAQRIVAQSALWSEGAHGADAVCMALVDGLPESAPEPAPPMYFIVVCAAGGIELPALPALSLFDDGMLSLTREHARALARERELAWDELDSRQVAEDRLAELVTAVNALASEREAGSVKSRRIEALEAELAQTQRGVRDALAREAAARAQAADMSAALDEARARLAYRESAQGWLRFPFAAARQRMAQRR
ncbi:MAG: class I SAM-dependent methyltransferase [Burkholderiales bacterium]|nr:class I SAM-dependent methyltransferase [Burkholderiales bacterium]